MAADARQIHIALNRFGLGAAPGEVASASINPRAYVLNQLSSSTALGLDLPAADAAFRETRMAEAAVQEARKQTAALKQQDMLPQEAMKPAKAMPNEAPVQQRIFRAEAAARIQAFAGSKSALLERLVIFWANHFAISANKGPVERAIAGAYEREAIRPFVLGRFADMLLAVEQHPAMQIYLDNFNSIGPNSRAGLARKRGLNENLAREILELHTLGVDGGYTQADVTSFANVITGWTIVPADDDALHGGRFTFAPARHEPGPQTVLGKTYPDNGLDQGRAILADLARHPATARHIARKLAAHFVADEPPPALVTRLEQVWVQTNGDLGAVTRALIETPESWSTPLTKMRTPLEFLAAMMRVTQRVPDAGLVLNHLNTMGQPLWTPPGPNGWPDNAAAWASADGMAVRLDVAAHWARLNGSLDPLATLDVAFGPAASPETRQAVSRAESRAQGLAILFMSPEFQRR